MGSQLRTAAICSFGIKIAAVLFFRIFPVGATVLLPFYKPNHSQAHLPSVVFTLFAIYAPVFLYTFFIQPELQIIDDEIDISIQETKITENGSNGTSITKDEIDITEKLTYGEPLLPAWKVVLWGTPNTRSPVASAAAFALNLLFVVLTADALFRGRWFYPANDLSMVRLGYVSHSEAKVLIREPDQSKMPIVFEMRSAKDDIAIQSAVWRVVTKIAATSQADDYTHIIRLPLKGSHQEKYEWRTSNNHTGHFLSAPKPGSMPTFNDGKFTFLSTSCILPRFPYNPLDHPLSVPGLRTLAYTLPELKAQFMLFLGDFIYVDVPQRFGKTIDEYRMQYRQVYAAPEWNSVAQNLSWIHVLDDHEISNDWSSNTTGVYKTAVEPFNLYQANVNPPRAVKAGTSSARRKEATWFEFAQGPASFFMLDTRSWRSSNSEPFEDDSKSMLGQEQLDDFLAWLARPEPHGVKWKIVASSVPFTKNWPVNVQDTWGGFLVERRKILEAMWDAGAKGMGVLILSGDRHEFAATKFPPPADSKWPQSAAAHEISTSPLNQFAFPFPSYKQTDGEDIKIKYIPSGNSKFGSFTIENIAGESSLFYQLYIDGKPTWNMTLHTANTAPSSGQLWSNLWS